MGTRIVALASLSSSSSSSLRRLRQQRQQQRLQSMSEERRDHVGTQLGARRREAQIEPRAPQARLRWRATPTAAVGVGIARGASPSSGRYGLVLRVEQRGGGVERRHRLVGPAKQEGGV